MGRWSVIFPKFKYFLGFDIERSYKGISVCQREYALEIIQDCGMLVAKRDKFPMEPNLKLFWTEGELLEDSSSYQRPDLSYSVQILSQFMDNPWQAHLDAANRVLRYLKSSQGQCLFFPSSLLFIWMLFVIQIGWDACLGTQRFVTGYCVFFFFLVIHSFLGNSRNNILFIVLLLRSRRCLANNTPCPYIVQFLVKK